MISVPASVQAEYALYVQERRTGELVLLFKEGQLMQIRKTWSTKP